MNRTHEIDGRKVTLNDEQMAIMNHTAHRSAGGFYCGDSLDMQKLIDHGLMELAGRKPFVSDLYFRLTKRGREALRCWVLESAPRAGFDPYSIIGALQNKQRKNFNRQWPPATDVDSNKPSEHVREQPATAFTVGEIDTWLKYHSSSRKGFYPAIADHIRGKLTDPVDGINAVTNRKEG